jgi:hypothetical protein
MTDCRIRVPIRRHSQARTELLPHPDRGRQHGDGLGRRPQWQRPRQPEIAAVVAESGTRQIAREGRNGEGVVPAV